MVTRRKKAVRWIFVFLAAGLGMAVAAYFFAMPWHTPYEQVPADMAIQLKPVVDGLVMPVHVTHAGEGSNRLFVIEKEGRVRIVRDGGLLPEPFLDIQDRVLITNYEQGLLSVAFHPDYAGGAIYEIAQADQSQVALDQE